MLGFLAALLTSYKFWSGFMLGVFGAYVFHDVLKGLIGKLTKKVG